MSSTVLSIIISSYNTSDLLRGCLQSIVDHPLSEPHEVIVIDDASSDGTSEMVRSRFPQVRLIRNPVNRHYTASNNLGYRAATGDYLLLLNSDTVIMPGALDLMVEFARARPDVGVIGCRLLNLDGTTQWSVKSLPNAEAALFGSRSVAVRLFRGNRISPRHLLNLSWNDDAPRKIEGGYVSGAASLTPRSVLDQVGLLDEDFVYHVDADHCKRICDAGFACYYLPAATIMHLNHRGGTLASLSRRFKSLLMFERHSYRYYVKHVRTAGRSPWQSAMQAVVAFCLSAHFVLLAIGQLYDYLFVERRFRARLKRVTG